MDKDTRSQIQRATQNARSLLEREFAEQLEGTFDIRPDGTIAAVPGDHLDAEQRLIRQKLVAAVNHHRPHAASHAEAVDAYRREAAFTMLNRFVAMKMLEARQLVQQCISQGDQSSGFKEFMGLAPGLVQLPDKGYRLYIECLFDEIAREVQVLFDRRDPASLLWPRRQALTDLLAILNASELAGVWGEAETIGWVYQYFNSDEDRQKARYGSDGKPKIPQNSYELAVRNQFFTPRYVVEFLTDNTLGRIWYEMRQGNTRLVEGCDYLVRRPSEVFLGQGKAAPAEEDAEADLSQEDLLKKTVYVPLRAKKDPRDLKILDPACGSGHFLLYTFDLLMMIYEEGWADDAATVFEVTGQSLRQDYVTLDELKAAVPELILRYNLHGIDIDPRAAQIASLALWMRAQQAYNDFRIARRQRQSIRKTNVVVAEPMPGEGQMVEEFAQTLEPAVLGNLFRQIVKEMELAGEAGSLLKIEESIVGAVTEARQQYQRWQQELSTGYLPGFEPMAMQGTLDLSGIDDESFFNEMEERMIDALRGYAEKAQNGQAYQRRLFAEDAARGFAFIDVCRQQYDAVLMNPPFGQFSLRWRDLAETFYADSKADIYAAFVARGLNLNTASGLCGAITSRLGFFASSLEVWRQRYLLNENCLVTLADLGHGVLDGALVEVAAYVICKKNASEKDRFWATGLLEAEDKSSSLRRSIENTDITKNFFLDDIRKIPGGPIVYWLPDSLLHKVIHQDPLSTHLAEARVGLQTDDDFRFLRLVWECPSSEFEKRWLLIAKGGEYSPFYDDLHLTVNWENNAHEMRAFIEQRYSWTKNARSVSRYGTPGLTYPERTTSEFSPRPLPEKTVFSIAGPAILFKKPDDKYAFLALAYTRLFRIILEVFIGGGDAVNSGSAARHYKAGILNRFPIPNLCNVEGDSLVKVGKECVRLAMHRWLTDETSRLFKGPVVFPESSFREICEKSLKALEDTFVKLELFTKEAEELAQALYNLNPIEEEFIKENYGDHPAEGAGITTLNVPELFSQSIDSLVDEAARVRGFSRQTTKLSFWTERRYETIALIHKSTVDSVVDARRKSEFIPEWYLKNEAEKITSYLLGCKFGRWYLVEQATQEELPDPFSALPVWSENIFSELGRAVEAYNAETVETHAILVDDPGSKSDISENLEQAFGRFFKNRSESITQEIFSILGLKTDGFRGYFQKNFFSSHIKAYSKSRRKAPIYWQLSIPSASYSVWLYYHRFTKDTFYNVLNDYVKPKLDYEERKLTGLTQEAIPNPSASQRKEIAAQEGFVAELRAFRDEVAIIAPLWNPSLNDGVIMNFAPLWRLVPHHRSWQKECKDCWDQLIKGDYDWAHLAMHLWPERVVPKCQTDRSLAIAHGLEEVFWEADDATGKWKPRQVSKEEIAHLIQERSSPAVKNALKSLLEAPAASGSTQTRSRRKKS